MGDITIMGRWALLVNDIGEIPGSRMDFGIDSDIDINDDIRLIE